MRIRLQILLIVMPAFLQAAFFRQDARVYRGEHLKAVAMPIGGIGTGTVWLAGDGRLSVWQIFNNFDELPLPDTFFAVRAQTEGSKALLKIAGGYNGWGLEGFEEVSCLGEYPFLVVRCREKGFPLAVDLTGFNPMIPLNTKDSALPCAIFKLEAKNLSNKNVDCSFLFSIPNPIGYAGGVHLQSRFYEGYGTNTNTYRTLGTGGMLHLAVADDQPALLSKPLRIFVWGRRDRAIVECEGVKLVTLPRRGLPKADAFLLEGLTGKEDGRLWQLLAEAARDGKPVVISGASVGFWRRLSGQKTSEPPQYEVFEDFEDGTYRRWTVEGTAFGTKPHTGTTPGQQHVSGFHGRYLVNSFLPDDGPQGRMISRPFKIRHRYIGMLVGGGPHKGRTCVNLLLGGKAVRSATGRAVEHLEPVVWDVGDLRGKEARIEIVDRESGPWGHINVDFIVFSDHNPQEILRPPAELQALASFIAARLLGAEEVDLGLQTAPPLPGAPEVWKITKAVRLKASSWRSYKILKSCKDVPVLIEGPFGKGRILVAAAKRIPASWAMSFLARSTGRTYRWGTGLSRSSPKWGDLTLCSLRRTPTVCARWTDAKKLLEAFAAKGRLEGPAESGPSPAGETYNAALAVSFKLRPGETKAAYFLLTWYFPNVERFGHKGNKYADWFNSARQVALYINEHFERLVDDTELFHDTMYETNLPYYVIDAVTSQLVIFRGQTCFWSQRHKATGKDYFAGFEGCYGCCPLNCTHVWNYAQGHACLFPEIGRNLRWYDFMHYLKESGESQHRQHVSTGAFIDGHCAIIEAAYREYLRSPDDSFLRLIYPRVKKAVQWLIQAIDPDRDGVNGGTQWNTYDVHTDGAHTFIGSQYLSALAAAERMASAVGDKKSASAWRTLRLKGSRNQDRLLWNGEYYIQKPPKRPSRDYLTGCHSDQLIGQWWAHMLNTGYLYPKERIRRALESIFKYNFRTNFRGFKQRPRRFVEDDDPGLLICTWPKGGRPDPFILYADEIWTGIEYEVAALMLYEGMQEEAFRIVKAVRDRYDGRLRPNLSSGPGGNPFNELECGKFYARALSSYSLLLAAQGFILNGPEGLLGFKPRYSPRRHRSFFAASEGWGLFSQTQTENRQEEEIVCRWGRIRVERLVFSVPPQYSYPEVMVNGKPVDHDGVRAGREVELRIDPVVLKAADTLKVVFRRSGS